MSDATLIEIPTIVFLRLNLTFKEIGRFKNSFLPVFCFVPNKHTELFMYLQDILLYVFKQRIKKYHTLRSIPTVVEKVNFRYPPKSPSSRRVHCPQSASEIVSCTYEDMKVIEHVQHIILNVLCNSLQVMH